MANLGEGTQVLLGGLNFTQMSTLSIVNASTQTFTGFTMGSIYDSLLHFYLTYTGDSLMAVILGVLLTLGINALGITTALSIFSGDVYVLNFIPFSMGLFMSQPVLFQTIQHLARMIRETIFGLLGYNPPTAMDKSTE